MTDRALYFISGSPPCWSVMLALEVKGLPYTPMRLDNQKREQKSPEYLAINPRGHVPSLVEGDTVVCETLAVLAYLDAAYPAPGLFGGDPGETARVWRTISECDGHLRGAVGDISRPLFRGKAQAFAEKIQDAAGQVRDELRLLEATLGQRPWLAGDTLSAADLIVFPIVMQLARAVARDEAKPLDLALYPYGEYFPNIDAWCGRIEALPGFERAYPPHWK